MTEWARRMVLSLALVLESLVFELLACAGVAGLMAEQGYRLNTVIATLIVWGFGVMYRAVFLHLYASWRLKRFLIARRFAAPLIALADLALALLYAGLLSLFFPPAEALFEHADWGVPIFSAIFLGSLLFSLFCRKQVVSVTGGKKVEVDSD